MPDGLGGDPGPAPIERPHREREALAHRADAVRVRDADALEDELGGRRAADAHLVLDALDAEAGHVLLDDEAATGAGGAASASRSVTAKTVIRSATLPWLMNRLRAVDDVSASPSRPARVRIGGDVGAGLRLGQGEGDELAAGGEIREPALLLLVGAGEEERQRRQLLDGEDQAARGADPADLLDREADASAGRRRGRRTPPGTAGRGCRGSPGAP